MSDLALDGRRASADVQPTGPIGRLARLILAGVFAASLVSLVDQGGVVGFRDPSVATELTVWILTAAMVAVFVTLVGAIASAAGKPWPWPWRLGVLALFGVAGVGAAIAGQATSGAVWGYPLSDLVWWFDAVMLVQSVVATLIAVVIGMPGCEVGVWPALMARARGGSSAPVAGPACVIGLHLLDEWEAGRQRQIANRVDQGARPKATRHMTGKRGGTLSLEQKPGAPAMLRYDDAPTMAVESVVSPPRSCPRCQASVSADARFCASCGQPLKDVTPFDDEAYARLTAAAPAPLIQKMRAARLTGERKPVTALFADVVGSTALAERMDPEDWTAMINEAFDVMSRAVFHYEGTIAQLQGDAMLAFFGAPVAHEDDPERAVFAALDMLSATDEFARQLKATHDIDFRIRAGINTGPVMVGNVGSDLRYEYTALGDAVNVAARMQAAAEPGTILITEMTRRLTGDMFELEDLGAIEVKGKAEPVHAFRALGRKAAPGRRRGLAAAGLDSPMVGRDEPLRELDALLDIVRAGRGRVAFVVGEPGIGKSRLLAELRAHVTGARVGAKGPAPMATTAPGAGAPVTWVEGRCVSYGRNLPYHLLIDIVRSILDIPFVGSEAETRATLDGQLASLLGREREWHADTAPYLAHLLALPLRPDEAERANLDGETIQGRYVAAAHRLLRALAARGPVVLVCEDLHWADPASIEVVRQLLPLASQLPILFLAALRADTDSAGWGLIGQARELFGDALTELRLKPLSEAESRTLVANLLEIESVPDHVREVILSRAEGNPFFVEEVVRMLIERGVIVARGKQWVATAEVGTVEIPETLHGLLLARIDQLPVSAKRSLRVAAVIGRQFPLRVLERILTATEVSTG